MIIELQDKGAYTPIKRLKNKIKVHLASSDQYVIIEECVKLNLQIKANNGNIMIRKCEAWILENDESNEVILGKPLMQLLGYNQDELLELAIKKGEIDASMVTCEDNDNSPMIKYLTEQKVNLENVKLTNKYEIEDEDLETNLDWNSFAFPQKFTEEDDQEEDRLIEEAFEKLILKVKNNNYWRFV